MDYPEQSRLIKALESIAESLKKIAAQHDSETPKAPPTPAPSFPWETRPCGCACHYMPGVNHIVPCCPAPPYRVTSGASANIASPGVQADDDLGHPKIPDSQDEPSIQDIVAAFLSLNRTQRNQVMSDVLGPEHLGHTETHNLAIIRARDRINVFATHPIVYERIRRAEPAEEPAEERSYAKNDAIARHAEKQGISWADSWRYFEREGYDMSKADPQYE